MYILNTFSDHFVSYTYSDAEVLKASYYKQGVPVPVIVECMFP